MDDARQADLDGLAQRIAQRPGQIRHGVIVDDAVLVDPFEEAASVKRLEAEPEHQSLAVGKIQVE